MLSLTPAVSAIWLCDINSSGSLEHEWPANRLPARTERIFCERETEEFGEQSDRGGTEKPVEFVFDVPVCP